MPCYSLVFRFRLTVFGIEAPFVALVTARGRVVLCEEGGSWTVSGVEPGGLFSEGSTARDALDKFREAFHVVMFECATESGGYPGFKAAAENLFKQIDTADDEKWWDAARRGEDPSDLNLAQISTDSPEARASIAVVRLDEARDVQGENVVDSVALARAA